MEEQKLVVEKKPVFKVKFECKNCGSTFKKKYNSGINISSMSGAYGAIERFENHTTVRTECNVCYSTEVAIVKRSPLKVKKNKGK